MQINGISVVVPTYKRVETLGILIADLLRQNTTINELIIVDGDPSSGLVHNMLLNNKYHSNWTVLYIPSDKHANAPFQRYLGWRASGNSSFLVFIDDDIQFSDSSMLSKLVSPLEDEENQIVGSTPVIQFPNSSTFAEIRTRYSPGGLTPVGDRIRPNTTSQPVSITNWLRGGVMAYRMDSITESSFLDSMFAMSHIRCGLGVDDTVLSRRIAGNSLLCQVNNCVVFHPSIYPTQAYPIDSLKHAYALNYSRRYLNDHYRVIEKSRITDRVHLIISYTRRILSAWLKFGRSPSRNTLAMAWGTTLGAIHGLIRPPTTKRLTPNIDWRADAEEALNKVELISDAQS